MHFPIDLRMAGLLNLDNIPNKQISGLGDEELEWVKSESNDRYVVELDYEIFKDLNDFGFEGMDADEFEHLENDIMKEMDDAEEAGIPNSTKISTTQYVNKLKTFLCS